MRKVEDAVDCFKEGYNCSQALFSTYAKELGVDPDTASKIASGFGGGIGCLGDICGAVTGAIMVISLNYGWSRAGDWSAKEKTYKKVQEFVNRFSSRRNSIKCKELLGHDISNPGERKKAQKENLFTTLCPMLIKDAAQILEDVLDS